ncbi:hypothetical protein [Streptomyces fulvorobeus]|uniref:DUF4449 domain-containing protein n=1 Tax=Streptomyces fulvorobeus TaxID=284028 RepID=A0A7J0CCZ9_9ACTN|nr:hypothetical protein [Streptomyces fulvorobeus]NYE43139.1 hypothetical protein [Streptomyces fulvorobeus]GFM99586.1 hypothetical protein Sfulv_43970 [Streptomyces fulvorobeus]
MRKRLFAPLWACLLLMLSAAVLAMSPAAPSAPATIGEAAQALRQGPVYVHPAAAGQLSPSQADALEKKIKDAGKPVFVAVLPPSADFPEEGLLAGLRNDTGITGLYAVRLGDGFDAGADRAVMPVRAVDNLVASVKTGDVGADAATQLNAFVDRAVEQARGNAPASWSGGAADGTGASATGLVLLGAVAVAGGAVAYAVVRRNRRRKDEEERAALDKLRVVVDEDITAYGETLERLDFHPAEPGADDTMRADYERALDSYESAKARMERARHPSEVRGVTQALEDGRYSLAVLEARRTGAALPARRPPCFFDPRHGPSVADVRWTPSGGAGREVPVCGADEVRLRAGEDPMSRTVDVGDGRRRPYWEAGPAYGPWAGGYFGGGLLPGLLVGTMLGSMLATPAYAGEYGGGDFGAGSGGEWGGGDVSGSDFNASDFGGFGDGGGLGGGGGFDGGGF